MGPILWAVLRGVAVVNIKLYGHVVYQIKTNDAYSNMVANSLPTDTPLALGVGSDGQNIFIFGK